MQCNNHGARLTDRQQRLVAENLGLVGVQLKRHTSLGPTPMRDREWDDLFQEGCLGLIAASRSYSPDTGIPFPAYALPRIHSAVSRALRGGFATVRQPLYPRRENRRVDPASSARTATLEFEPQDRRPNQHDHNGPSVGGRIRTRYVQLVRQASARMKQARPARADRAAIVDRVVEQRLLVPDPDERTSLRAIARQSGSSYARIAQCERRMLEEVRAEFDNDAEIHHLREAARRSPDGMNTIIDADLARELDQVRVNAFVAHLDRSPPEHRGALLLNLIQASGSPLEDIVRSSLASMSPERQTSFLDDCR